jgi:hypothetical protein
MEAALNKMGVMGVGFVVAGVIGSQFIFVVDGGERKLVMDSFRGLQQKVYGEGFHFMIPGLQRTISFEIRTMSKL